MTNRKIIEDVCGCDRYCLLKEIILSGGFTNRFLEQLKCIEKFKYLESGKRGEDIGWPVAHELWEERNYAKKFSEVYKEGMKYEEIWERIFNSSDKKSSDKHPEIYHG